MQLLNPTWLLCRSLQVDRKQVPADWSRKLQAIQAKAAEVGGTDTCPRMGAASGCCTIMPWVCC